jgi:hypothetical protein
MFKTRVVYEAYPESQDEVDDILARLHVNWKVIYGSGHRRPWELTLHHLSVSEILCAARRHEGVTCAPAWANPSPHKLGLPEFRGPDSGRATRLHGERAHLARPLQFKPELFPRGPRCASP